MTNLNTIIFAAGTTLSGAITATVRKTPQEVTKAAQQEYPTADIRTENETTILIIPLSDEETSIGANHILLTINPISPHQIIQASVPTILHDTGEGQTCVNIINKILNRINQNNSQAKKPTFQNKNINPDFVLLQGANPMHGEPNGESYAAKKSNIAYVASNTVSPSKTNTCEVVFLDNNSIYVMGTVEEVAQLISNQKTTIDDIIDKLT